ncbi:HPr family phosphocarrier protein [Robertmurraya sp. P23]|uniref:HPr family phosphocarrier protein n=1 Tax=Robertmurraya sp. P23 TaxID=3436931 RepID=UPI003D97C69C
MKKEFKITTSTGFARPATLLVNAARKFESNIFLEYQGRCVHLNQSPSHALRDIMLLGIIPGSEIIVSVVGIDEYEAIQFIKEQLANYYLLRG